MPQDSNICCHCNLYHPLGASSCSRCGQTLVLGAKNKVAIWRLGDIQDGLLGGVVTAIWTAFSLKAVIQPAFLDERPSLRPSWKGRSATALLNQMSNRNVSGTVANLCIAADTVTCSTRYNFLFGMAWLGLGAAVMGIEPLAVDDPEPEILSERMAKIAVHELGHAFGLEDMPYDHADCVMCGDTDLDSLDTLDHGSIDFCGPCMRRLQTGLHRSRNRAR
ncbi:MAG: hypothetical protein RJA19_1322 [Bacteroidota bacterium]|jgi:predicted Zn-dependent protease